jgi:two-component system sensor histidine kinase PhcS
MAPYHAELSEFRVAYSRAGCVTSIVLVLAGVGLDGSMYPDWLGQFFLFRLTVALVTGLVLALLYTPAGKRHVRSLTMFWLALPQVMIGVMIGLTEGTHSIYFVGLHLALYAVGIILPISLFEGVGFGLLTCGIYVLACMLHPDGLADRGRFTTHLLFILFSAGASAVCTWYNERARHRLFSLQHEVAEKNGKLLENNVALAEVKGQLIQREKMAALGTLSAGLLHEVNNPVNYSLMALNMAMAEPAVAASPELKESLVDAREGMQRVQNIVSDLKTFAYQKPGENSNRVFLLEKAVDSARRLTGYELKGIAFSVELPLDTHVMGDEPAMIGVLINLLSNAAMAVHNAERAEPRIDVRGEARAGRLHVTVRDNGTGIKGDNITRVFEPFFTTRDVGQGLGLGLAVSYAIIQRHGGELAVTSEEGEWTEFAFDLALASPQS